MVIKIVGLSLSLTQLEGGHFLFLEVGIVSLPTEGIYSLCSSLGFQ